MSNQPQYETMTKGG